MATQCFNPIFGKRLRVTRLDQCGRVPDATDDCAQVTTDGFVSVSLTSETEDATEIVTRKADGSLCVNEMGNPSFKRFTLELEFCGVDPDLFEMVTNGVPYEDYNGDTNGIVIPEGDIDSKFALELWTGLTGQACPTGDAVEEASGYMLLPYLNAGVLGDLTIDGENAISFTLTGAFTKGGNAWGEGPYDVVFDDADAPAPLPTPLDPLDHLLLMQTGVAPPPAACGCQPLTPVMPS